MSTVNQYFEVQMLGSGTPCATGQGHRLSRTHIVACLHQVFPVMAVERRYAKGMPDDHAIAIARHVATTYYNSVEGCPDAVARNSLQVHTRVMPPAFTVRTDDFGTRQWIVPVVNVCKVERKAAAASVWIGSGIVKRLRMK